MAIFSFNVRMIDQNELKTNVIFFHIRNQHIIYTNGHIISMILLFTLNGTGIEICK